MASVYFTLFGSAVVGCALAVLWWLLSGRKQATPRNGFALSCLVAGALGLLVPVALRFLSSASLLLPQITLPAGFWQWHRDNLYRVPLVLGIIALIVLAYPLRARPARGTADLARRTPLSFGRRWWFVVPPILLAAIAVVTIAAGTASQPDEHGRYRMYTVSLGPETSMGTNIYGWYYSVPSMLLIAVLIATALANLILNARPPLAPDREADLRLRRLRTRHVIAVTSAALLLHLGIVLESLAGTSMMSATVSYGRGEFAHFWTSFAAMEPALRASSFIAAALGYCLWAAVALSAMPARRRIRVTAGS